MRKYQILAAIAALAMLVTACATTDTTDTTSTGSTTGDATTGATAPDTSGAPTTQETAAAMTPQEIADTHMIGLPDDFEITDGREAEDGTFQLEGTYSADPQGIVASMVAAGWEHLMTRDGSFNISLQRMVPTNYCVAHRSDTNGNWAMDGIEVDEGTDCDTWALDRYPGLKLRIQF